MATAVVSALLSQLTSITRELVEKNGAVDDEVENLRRNLKAIGMVIMDAEKRQQKEKAVKHWLEELKDVSYDMDSVLDEWSTAIRRSENEEGENEADDSRIADQTPMILKVCFSFVFSCFHYCKINLQAIIDRLVIAFKIKNLNGKLEKITSRMHMFDFVRRSSSEIDEFKRSDTYSFLDVPVVYGQDEYKKILIDLLLSSGSKQEDKELKFIPIVGMGGIGKTTLAKTVYNDYAVETHFKKYRFWVCVSDRFDIVKIAKGIIEQLTGTPILVGSEALMQKFCESIKDKKFLLVLDDVWTTNHMEWEPLKLMLKSGAIGSRVVVTTRNEKVAKMIGDTHMIGLNKLSEKDCWLLLSEIAFSTKTKQEREDFEETTRKIAQKCDGLPLAAKTLGSLLSVKESGEFQDTLQSEIWDLENVEEALFNPLLLSYNDLPPVERRCFMYCAIFPKDYMFDKDDLIWQWIAQDYFKSKNSDQEVELIGERCFQNLAMRSFFQDFECSSFGGITIKCKMHDIVRDFAQYLTLNEYSIVSIFDAKKRVDFNARHLNLIISPMIEVPTVSISNKKNLHTLMVLYNSECEISDNSSRTCMLPHQFLDLTCLRTLILRGQLMKVPKNIGDFIHLRYLCLLEVRYNKLINVPPTIGNLFNLQTLKLLGPIGGIPEEVGKLINLRHLEASYSASLSWPKSIGKLRSLQTLASIRVSSNYQNFQLRDFRNLNNVRDLSLYGLGIQQHLEEAKEAQLHKKSALVRLFLNFNGGDTKMKNHERVLETLQPHENLKCLEISFYNGRFISPTWMMSLINLRRLVLNVCNKNDTLPPLGKLPCLELLYIIRLESLIKIGPEFLGVQIDNDRGKSKTASTTFFPNLKEFKIQIAESLRKWVGSSSWRSNDRLEIMPRLETLTLDRCSKLESLPDFLESTPLKHLKIIDCPILEKCWLKGIGNELYKILHVPNIDIRRVHEPVNHKEEAQEWSSSEYSYQGRLN